MNIKVYTASNCPYCIKLKNFLKENGIKFKEINISIYPEAVKELKNITGQVGVPVLLFGNQKIVGFNEEHLRKVLNIKRRKFE
ncbi:MAG: glutaredoxin family protein [candidate division WOR-3 bacterium]